MLNVGKECVTRIKSLSIKGTKTLNYSILVKWKFYAHNILVMDDSDKHMWIEKFRSFADKLGREI